jgi:copper chaperone CopZ
VRSPGDTGTVCATCARNQKQRAASQPAEENSDHLDRSPRNSAIQTPEGSGTSDLVYSSLSPTSANARCDGSQIANCLDNGCSRSFGGDCNCVEDCSCNSPTSLSASRMAPLLTSSNTITSVATSASQTTSSSGVGELHFPPRSTPSSSTLGVGMMPRVVLQVKPSSALLGIDTIMGMLSKMPGVRSVHVVPDNSARPSVATSEREILAGCSNPDAAPSTQLVVVRGGESLDLDMSLGPLRSLQLAQVDILERSCTIWRRKEVVLRVPDMMCPGNCGSSVLNAARTVEGVEAARLRFEQRQIVVRGDMNVDSLRAAVTDIGFDSMVDAETPLPRRFRFRVDDLSDVGLTGAKLEKALNAVEGVENLVLLSDRVELLVIAMLLDSTPLVEAAERVGFEMLELSEEAWGIPMEVVPAPLGQSNEAEYYQPHKCDMSVCPQNGCPRYMTTVAHTAALAVGWAVPGCGMSAGGECTCGDSCKCEGCPEHNPVS